MRFGSVLLTLMIAAGGTVASAQVVVGKVTQVGFRSAAGSAAPDFVHFGRWMPIQVELSVQGSLPFQGQLRYEAPDLDGDLAVYREIPVTVTPGAPKRAWIYGAWMRRDQMFDRPQSVDVLGQDGTLVTRLPLPPFEFVYADTIVVLDLSDRPLTKLRNFQTPGWTYGAPGYGRPYYQNILVANMPAREIPDRWFGLEAVDVIVWDAPNPAALSIAQVDALVEWTRRGGQLVLGLGSNWPAVADSPLEAVLPVQARAGPDGRGPVATRATQTLAPFFRNLVGGTSAGFDAPVAVAVVAAQPDAYQAFRAQLDDGSVVDLVSFGFFESGRVTTTAAALRDLMNVPVTRDFFRLLFDFNETSDAFRKTEAGSIQSQLAPPQALYRGVVAPVGLAGLSGLLVLAAFAFVVAYIGLATLASWWWLRGHGLSHLSWTAFAVIAIVGSVLSLGTVRVLRGISQGVQTFCIVDGSAGSRAAQVATYLGYSSPTRQVVDLALPGEGSFLRSLTPGPAGASVYATPQRYSAIPEDALLADTYMRATLKQFEGFWSGELSGSVRAQVVVDRATGEVLPTSWIENGLDVPLAGGYLLYVDPRFPAGRRPVKPAGSTASWWGWQGVPPAKNILAVWVPPLRPGEKVNGLGADTYAEIAEARESWRQRQARRARSTPETWPDLISLFDVQQWWVGARSRARIRSLDTTARDALLAATRKFYLPVREDDGNFDKLNNRPITTDGLMDLDVTHWLAEPPAWQARRGSGVLLLFADAAGPVRLERDGELLRPGGGRTFYRLRVPIGYRGEPVALPPPLETFEP